MQLLATLSLLGLLICGCDNATQTTPSVDNSAINERDESARTNPPLDQGENQQDIDITAGIRSQLVASKMSSNAQNVKIVTQNGQVTLRGPVSTDEEKQQIEAIARQVAGSSKVDSQIDVSRSN